jgi:N-acetylglucosamine kinase-like BadF-type ATPase
VASFAADVARAADEGDEYARAILSDAARELAISACAAAGRLFEPAEEVLISYAGSVFQCGELISEPFRREVASRWPGATVVDPAGDPLAGALLLVELASELPEEPGILARWP